MIKEIKYSGHTASASDYLAPDGELIASMGLVPEDGSLKPVQPPHCVLSLDEGYRVLFVHTTTAGDYYIIADTENNLYFTSDGVTLEDMEYDQSNILSANAIGNTLLILSENGMYYYLFGASVDDGIEYKYLGNHIPELPISFGLVGAYTRDDEFHVDLGITTSGGNTKYAVFKDDSTHTYDDEALIKEMTNSILAKVNKIIAEKGAESNRFIFPFIVRYAFRLYDGSIVMQSAPIFMPTTTDVSPEVYITKLNDFEQLTDGVHYSFKSVEAIAAAMRYKLDYSVISETPLNNLKEWKDIVKSVDIFVSKPIYTYDQNGSVDTITNTIYYSDTNDYYSICKQVKSLDDEELVVYYDGKYKKVRMVQRYTMEYHVTNQDPKFRFVLPKRSDADINEDICDCHNFYLIKSIPVDELKLTRTIIDLDDGKLNSLVQQEVMPDDYDSHCILLPTTSYNFNARINLAGLSKIIYDGHNVLSSHCFCDTDNNNPLKIHYYLKKDGKEYVVTTEQSTLGDENPLFYIYYPDTNAYKAIIEYGSADDETYCVYKVELKAHATLNGAYYFNWKGVLIDDNLIESVPTVSSSNTKTISIKNKIYTSEVNNPFYFPLLGINSVGSGEIIGICSAAKALSQGQFGQFPLYAFTTEGVWALSVSDTGSYSAKQPITRDVCTSAESITQLDSAVLFATDRGIMLISGSDSQCITDTIDNMLALDDAAELPLLTSVMTQYGYNYQMKFAPLHKFLVGSRMLYAYVPQRIIIYNPQYDYAYVYSLKSKAWGMMPSTIKSNVPSYPEALAMLSNNKLVDFCENEVDANNKYITPYKGMLITRPLKLDMPDTLKTIDTVIQRGEFEKGHVKTLCYGSRDLYNWFYVNSSKDHYLRGFRGTPYKYFKLVSLCSMDVGETLSGATVQHTPREINQPR